MVSNDFDNISLIALQILGVLVVFFVVLSEIIKGIGKTFSLGIRTFKKLVNEWRKP